MQVQVQVQMQHGLVWSGGSVTPRARIAGTDHRVLQPMRGPARPAPGSSGRPDWSCWCTYRLPSLPLGRYDAGVRGTRNLANGILAAFPGASTPRPEEQEETRGGNGGGCCDAAMLRCSMHDAVPTTRVADQGEAKRASMRIGIVMRLLACSVPLGQQVWSRREATRPNGSLLVKHVVSPGRARGMANGLCFFPRRWHRATIRGLVSLPPCR